MGQVSSDVQQASGAQGKGDSTVKHIRWFDRCQLPWQFVPRRFMPQVDEADMSALVEWLSWNKIEISEATRTADQLSFRQHVNFDRVRSMPDDVFNKPIFISNDGVVLDGNHRAWAHKLANKPAQCLVIDLPFAQAIKALFSFAGTYDYAQRGHALSSY
jgi:hypothetical protein